MNGSADAVAASVRAPSTRVLDMDRTTAFSRARWHSRGVRLMRMALPVAAAGVVVLYVGQVMVATRLAGTIDRSKPGITVSRELTMDRPRFDGATKDGGTFLVTAVSAIPDLPDTTRIKLNGIAGELFDVRKQRTDIAAAKGLYDTKANRLDLSGGITVLTAAGMKADLETATILTKDGTLKSDRPARVTGPQGTIRSDTLDLDQKAKRIGFIGGVVAALTPPPRDAEAKDAPAKAAGPVPAFGNSGQPIDVTSDRLDVDDAGKIAIFSGKVRATQAKPIVAADPANVALTGGGATIETERLEIAYVSAPQPAAAPTLAPGEATRATPAPGGGSKLERIIVPGPLIMTQPGGTRITGNSAQFDAIGEVAVVAGNVLVGSGLDRRASGDRVEFNQRADTILMTGNVIVTQAQNEIRGRRLFLDRKSGRTEVASPAEAGLAKSRMFARLSQAKEPATGAAALKQAVAPAVKAVAGAAEDAGFGLTTFRTDPNAPVDVEADRLVVEDTKKEATFTGDVRAAQGDFLIRSNDLKAYYSGETGLVADPSAAPAGAKAQAQLNRLEARGKVVVTSKAAQQVTGDWAIFDTKANTVTVGGSEVVITQGPNIVKGSKLVIDMTTGQSIMTRDAPAVATSGTSDPSGSSSLQLPATRPGRSSLTLYPSTLERKPGASSNAPGNASSNTSGNTSGNTGAGGAVPGSAPRPAVPKSPASTSWGATAQPARP
ncbi:MAG: LPS export ABC transporter periplasmic protein LptC [Hyphomicrobiaceae bacterium]|nr:LPS export ABC transporter periplasmic protein LptC [Hyphomicrobiaceae bacterium]